MCRISECKLAQKLQACDKKGLAVCLTVSILACLVIVGIIVKICCLKKKFECLEDCCNYDCEFEDDEVCDCDENGCSYTSEKDFV